MAGGGAGGPAGGGGSGWVFTEANYNAGYTSSSYTGGTWLLDNHYLLDIGAYTIPGNQLVPTYNGTGTMLGNEGNGFAKITLVSLVQVTGLSFNINAEISILEENNPTNEAALSVENEETSLINSETDISNQAQITDTTYIEEVQEFVTSETDTHLLEVDATRYQ